MMCERTTTAMKINSYILTIESIYSRRGDGSMKMIVFAYKNYVFDLLLYLHRDIAQERLLVRPRRVHLETTEISNIRSLPGRRILPSQHDSQPVG